MGPQDQEIRPTNPLPEHAHTLQPTFLSYGVEKPQFGALCLPEGQGPHPVVILIHGGFWRAFYGLGLMHGLAEDLVRHGIAAWNIEYRRVGDLGGGWPGTFLDVAAAADHLRTVAPTYRLDLQRVVAVGHSAGGHLACWLAARRRMTKSGPLSWQGEPLPLKGVVSQAGAIDLELVWRLKLGRGAAAELLGGSPRDVPERYRAGSPTTFLPLGVPQVLVHGTKDDNVPLEVSESYTQKALQAGDPATLTVLPGVDHFALIEPTSSAWRTTIEAVQFLLKQ